MNEYMTVRNQKCPNPKCTFYDQPMRGNVVVHSRKHGRLQCKECGRTWVMHREEATYGMRTDLEKVRESFQLLANRVSVRKVAEKLRISPSTVQRWKKKFHNQKVFNS